MASRGINKVILVGNLGADPQVRYTPPPDSIAITNLSVATSRSWKNKTTGQQEEQTEWHRVVLYNRLAEVAGEYLRKGSKVYIEGSLRTRKWSDNSGVERYTTEVIANEMQMLDSKSARDFGEHDDNSGQGFARSTSATSRPAEPAATSSEFDDDIPF